MALENLTTIEGIEEAAAEGDLTIQSLYAALQKATGLSADTKGVLDRLKLYISALEDEEKNLLEKFDIHCSDIQQGERELQKKFNDFYMNTGLNAFIGSDLEKTILDDYAIGIELENAEFAHYIEEVIKPEMLKISKEEGTVWMKETAAKYLNDTLNGLIATVDVNGSVFKKRTVSSGRAITEDGNIIAKRLTTAQKNRILFLLNHGPNKNMKKIKPKVTYTTNNNIITISVNFNWYDITQGLKPSEAKKRWKKDDKELKKKNEQIIKLIISKVNPAYSGLVESYIWNMVNANPYLFFVGANVRDITGLLGELSALIAISELLSNKYKNSIVTWVAQHKTHKGELSIDILLENIAGIQVKNTSRDINNMPILNIHFAQGQGLLSDLERYYGIRFTTLEPIFESEAFNVPVATQGSKYVAVDLGFNFKHGVKPADWEDFENAYNNMHMVIEKAKTFLTAFSPDFLYMSGGTDFQNQLANLSGWLQGGTYENNVTRANTLYIIAGKPQLASSMLKDIITNIENLQELIDAGKKPTSFYRFFNVEASLGNITRGKKDIPFNYAEYANQNKRDEILRNKKVKYTSSYNFSTL